MSYSTASGQTMNNTDSSAEQDTNETKDRGFPKAYVPEIFEEFLNRLLPNDILQEQYLDTLVTQAVERHNDGSSERLLTFIFHALEVVVQRDNRPDDLTRTLDTTKALVQKIRMLLSYENNHQLGDFVDRVKAKLSEPLLVATSAQEDRQSILDGIDGVIDLSCKLDSNLFLLLFSVSRLSSLKNTISPTISNLIFLIGQWLTRMKVSCLHQIRKGLSLIQLFLPHIEASECFVPEMITYCFSTLSLFVREDSVIRDTLSLYNFSQSESLQRMIRQTIVNDSKQLWVEEEGKTDVIFRVFACNGVSCKSNESEDWRELSKMLCDLFVTCRDIIIRLCRIFKSFDAFHGLILPFMKGLHEISEDEEIWPALRIDSESFASSLKEMIHVTEERGLKPLQLYYKKSSSLPVEYEPKLKDNIRWQNSHRLKQHVRKEKKKTMKWLQLETNRQQQEKLSQKKNEDLYRAKRAKEATSFLQQQQENWNKQEKKWKNVKKSSL
ncbi:hypothetical protein Gasu2_11570 [Galdieria sulphuraria]|nr:hypothetical protein Gasu2_11570 [Galdieria sulphuraria]